MRAIWAMLAFSPLAAAAATYTVDTASDATLSACTAAPADCSLRGAIDASNALNGSDLILFDLPTSDPGYQPASQHWLIQVGATALPPITDGLTIDGYSQPGASANTQTPDQGGSNAQLKIEIRGTQTQQNGFAIGNVFNQPAVVVRGLAINRFAVQVFLAGASAHRVEGCFLGTTIDGSAAAVVGNSGLGVGVRAFGPGPYVVGGVTPDARNLMSGMSAAVSSFSSVDGLRIQGNLIGTNAAGNAAIGNQNNGLEFTGPVRNSLIGGDTSDARNIIAASRFVGLYLSTSSGAGVYSGTRVIGNYFGTDVSGRLALGNGLNPQSPSQPQATIQMFLGGECQIQIGGLAPGEANLIAHSGAAGIQIGICERAALRGNRYRANRGLPVDLSASSNPDGITPNDAGDPDSGGNRLQNFPTFSLPPGFLPAGGASVELTVTVDSAVSNSAYPLTVDAWRAACGGGADEWLGSLTIDAINAQLPLPFTLARPDGRNILPLVLQVTDANGNSSEFSANAGDAIRADGFEDTASAPTGGRCS